MMALVAILLKVQEFYFLENLLSKSFNTPAIPQKTLFFVFFISGFCSLLYQLVWIRLAFAAFGVNTPVLSAVLSFFMAGLALGSWWGGHWASRSPKINPILFYSLSELLIAIGAFILPLSFSFGARLLLSVGEADSGSYLFLSAVVMFFSLLPWSFFMGTTFPFMMAFIKKHGGSKDSFSFLYTANTLGAMAGVFATAFILIECLGLKGTLTVAACLNLLIALTGLALSSRLPSTKVTALKTSPSPSSENQTARQVPILYLMILFTTGFVFMAMEVVWTRGFTYILQTEVYSYASLLFTYLLSTFIGSWLYRHDRNSKTVSLGIVWVLVFICALLTVVINDPRIHHSAIFVLLSIFPVCAVLGYLTPLLIDKISSGNPEIAGRAYALNVLGCILGPLAASYLLLPNLGTKVSLILLSLFLSVFFISRNLRSIPLGSKIFWGILSAGLLGTAVFWTISYEDDFYRYFQPESRMRRDYCATVITNGSGLHKNLSVNGIGMTGLVLPTKVMAHLPMVLLTHKPQSALDICFGMGTTFRSLLSWNIDTTAVELVPSVFKSYGDFWPDADRLRSLPQAHMVVDDGRRFLRRTRGTYDVITIDPPPPLQAAASSLLYSTEFYELVKQHLKKGGLLQQWVPIGESASWQAIAMSLKISFPNVVVFPSDENMGAYFIASLDPIEIPSSQDLKNKMPVSALVDLSEWVPYQQAIPYLAKILSNARTIDSITRPPATDRITDDRPFNEYYLLRKLKWVLFHT
jgi:spermidine synthase